MNVHFCLAKIVQGECNGKGKAKDFHFLLPSRSLSYPKIVQGECNGKGKAKDFHFLLPSRSLSLIFKSRNLADRKKKAFFSEAEKSFSRHRAPASHECGKRMLGLFRPSLGVNRPMLGLNSPSSPVTAK